MVARSYNEEQDSQDIKKEVLERLKERENIERSLPSFIVIGPFYVQIEAVRQSLMEKKKAFADRLLQKLALKLRKEIENVSKSVF